MNKDKQYGKFTYVDIEEVFKILWGRENCGWGEFTFFPSEGKIYCDNECMSKEFIKETLCELVDRCELRWDEERNLKDEENSLNEIVRNIKTYEFYDIPRLSIGRDIIGSYYLVLNIEETEEELTWLYSKLNLWNLFELEGSTFTEPKYDLYTFFKENKNNFIVKQKKDNEVSIKRIEEVLDEWLPKKGIFLKDKKGKK